MILHGNPTPVIAQMILAPVAVCSVERSGAHYYHLHHQIRQEKGGGGLTLISLSPLPPPPPHTPLALPPSVQAGPRGRGAHVCGGRSALREVSQCRLLPLPSKGGHQLSRCDTGESRHHQVNPFFCFPCPSVLKFPGTVVSCSPGCPGRCCRCRRGWRR